MADMSSSSVMRTLATAVQNLKFLYHFTGCASSSSTLNCRQAAGKDTSVLVHPSIHSYIHSFIHPSMHPRQPISPSWLQHAYGVIRGERSCIHHSSIAFFTHQPLESGVYSPEKLPVWGLVCAYACIQGQNAKWQHWFSTTRHLQRKIAQQLML